jgi:hypothetical protein
MATANDGKFPTVYLEGWGGGDRWGAIYQALTVEEAQAYIDQFSDNREIRWAKYNPERVQFTNGKGYREYGVQSSKKLLAFQRENRK